MNTFKKLIWPVLAGTRKAKVAAATVIAAILAEYGWEADPELIVAIIATGSSWILGIAIEDAGEKANK